MNQIFTFHAALYKTDRNAVVPVALQASGSTETRARRRVLQNMNDSGMFVRTLELVGCKPAKEQK